MQDHVIGIDIGTTGTKTGIYDRGGGLVAEAFEESVLRHPRAGHVEQDPDEIFGSAVRTIRTVTDKAGLAPERIAALAFDGQMAGLMAIDADWTPVTHYDSWLDTRCAPWLETLRPHEDDLIRSCGMGLAFNHAPKILYWRDEHPDIWEEIASFIQPAAYVAGRLAGLKGSDAFMDWTYLVFSGYGDSKANCWNEELLSRFDLTTDKLPRITAPWEIIGHVTKDYSNATGLAQGTPIAAGCGDQAANVLGAGLVDSGVVFDTSGTASVFATTLDSFKTDTTYRCLMTCPHVLPGLFYPMAYVAGGGLNLRWFRDALSPMEKEKWIEDGIDPYDALCEEASQIAPGADGLIFLPHFSGRNTPVDPDMRGAFLGLTWRHEKPHMVRAIMESIAYEYAYFLRAVRELDPDFNAKIAYNIGGGARSRVLRQIKADVLGLDYCSLTRDEFGTLGSAIIAGHAVGLFPDIRQTARAFNQAPPTIVRARADMNTTYEPFLNAYADALTTVSPYFRRCAEALAETNSP